MSELSADRLPDLDRGRLLSLPAFPAALSMAYFLALEGASSQRCMCRSRCSFLASLITVEQCLHLTAAVLPVSVLSIGSNSDLMGSGVRPVFLRDKLTTSATIETRSATLSAFDIP
jgi:hypothetical protein